MVEWRRRGKQLGDCRAEGWWKPLGRRWWEQHWDQRPCPSRAPPLRHLVHYHQSACWQATAERRQREPLYWTCHTSCVILQRRMALDSIQRCGPGGCPRGWKLQAYKHSWTLGLGAHGLGAPGPQPPNQAACAPQPTYPPLCQNALPPTGGDDHHPTTGKRSVHRHRGPHP